MSGHGGDPFDSLPAAIAADILSLVADASDIAACRLASRPLLAASYACSRIRLRAAAGNVASLLGPHLRCLELDASEGRGHPDDAAWVEEGEFDEGDDLHLTAMEAVAAWAATAAGAALREVAIADYWPQSCWRKAEALPVISRFCHNLLKLRLRNAWLSVDGLRTMANLTHLTLEFIRLDDEDLTKLNECFPCLQILNLIGVEGSRTPRLTFIS
uniref:F-box domain-containing protein n=1 Tax=Leersia perrieri TaxID=77586 RepID=A0A0D9UXU6_9ORYZ